jgi:1,4-alpha-glucan branching enzyme
MPAVSPARERGALAIVLHTHMPYVEGFGTWPFGEEWLWEAFAGCYLPLLDLLDAGAPLTLSLTPVLCDQLEAPGLGERFGAFVEGVRRHTHEEDAKGLRAAGHDALAGAVERSWEDYAWALQRFEQRERNLLGAFERHAQWTSSATHAILPLVATDAGARLQVQTGVQSHRRRFDGRWRGGFWLPECAYAPWLEATLADAGVRATCVELSAGLGTEAPEHLRPWLGETGVAFVPIDRATISLVWSDRGYPAGGGYRDYHHHTLHSRNPWSNDGRPYDPARALALAEEHAADFVARTVARLRAVGAGLPGGGLAVCALDSELLGHWWYEGVAWLAAVVEQCARQGLQLMRLDDALQMTEPVPLEISVAPASQGSWGHGGDLSTWSGPAVAELAFAARAAELQVLAARPPARSAAVRELLALQASDWAFMISRGTAAAYALERAEGHGRALERALAGEQTEPADLRNLAVYADPALVRSP